MKIQVSDADLLALTEGRMYAFGESVSLAAAAVRNYRLLTGATAVRVRIKTLVLSNVPSEPAGVMGCSVSVFSGSTTSVSGGAAALMNQNRVSSAVATPTLTTAPTITGDGTLISFGLNQVEVILAPATLHILRVTNQGGNTGNACVRIEVVE